MPPSYEDNARKITNKVLTKAGQRVQSRDQGNVSVGGTAAIHHFPSRPFLHQYRGAKDSQHVSFRSFAAINKRYSLLMFVFLTLTCHFCASAQTRPLQAERNQGAENRAGRARKMRERSETSHPCQAGKTPVGCSRIEASLYLHFGKNHLEGYVDYRWSQEGRTNSLILSSDIRAAIAIDERKPEKGLIQFVPADGLILRTSLSCSLAGSPVTESHRVEILGLVPHGSDSIHLEVAFSADPDVSVTSLLPGNWEPVTGWTLGAPKEPTALRFDEYRDNVLLVGIKVQAPSRWNKIVNSQIISYSITQTAALVVLVITMMIKGFFVVRASQRGELEYMRRQYLRIAAEPEDPHLKQELIRHIKELQTKQEYAAYDTGFTGPLDEILKLGIIGAEVTPYDDQIKRMRLDLRMSWVFFR